MPSIISTGTASARAFGNESGGLYTPPNIFVYNTNPSYTYNNITKTAVDSSGNFYIAGVSNSFVNSSYGLPYLIKTNSSGSILWSTEIAYPNTSSQVVKDIFIDNSNNIWLSFTENASPTYYSHVLILNSNGAYVNGYYYYYTSSGYQTVMSSFCKDSSGNVYVAYSTIGIKTYIYKFTSPSSYSLFATTASGGFFDAGNIGFLLCDSSNNIYAVGSGQYLQSGYYGSVAKINTSGTVVSASYYSTPTAGYDGSYIINASIDSSNNIYLYIYAFVSGGGSPVLYALIKVNSSLSIVYNYNFTIQSSYTPLYISPIVGNNLISTQSLNANSYFATINISGATPTISYGNNFLVNGTTTYSNYTGFNFDGTYAYVFYTLNQTPSPQILWGKIEYTNAVTRTTPTIVDNPSFYALTQAASTSRGAISFNATSYTAGNFGTGPNIGSETPTLSNPSFASLYTKSTF